MLNLISRISRLAINTLQMPGNIAEIRHIARHLDHAIRNPTASNLGKTLLRDNHLTFMYLSKGIELHPHVKRESDALVGDLRDANRDAQVRYQLAADRIPNRSVVLDCASGYGAGTSFLQKATRAEKIVGADYFKPGVDFASRVFGNGAPGIEFVHASALDRDAFGESQFDAIVSLETIEHLDDDGLAFENFALWLKPGGSLCVSVPNENVVPFKKETHPFHYRHYSMESLSQCGSQVGFSLSECFEFGADGVSENGGRQLFAVFRL